MPKAAAILHREYPFTPEELIKLLDLRGDKVFKITTELGIYSFWTAGAEKDADA